MNCEGPYLAERFFHDRCSYFDTAFARTGNTFVEIAVAKLYLDWCKKLGIKEVAVPEYTFP